MIAEKYLNSLKYRKERLAELEEHRAEVLEKATSIGCSNFSMEKVQTSHTNDRMGNAVTKSAELAEQIEQEKKQIFDDELEMTERIRGLHDVDYVRILYKVHIQSKPLRQVAQEIKKSYTFVRGAYKKALMEFERVYFMDEVEEDSASLVKSLLEVEQEKHRIMERETELKNRLQKYMEENKIDKLEDASIRVNYIDSFQKKLVDAKRLREFFPEAYRECIKLTDVKPFVKLQVLE